MKIRKADVQDISFIDNVYNLNIDKLHGKKRSHGKWLELLNASSSEHFIVSMDVDVGWIRLDYYKNYLELGMIQIHPNFQNRGIGKKIIIEVENFALKNECKTIIIHTTEDNVIAQKLYASSGYILKEIGPCNTADGVERVGYTYIKEFTI